MKHYKINLFLEYYLCVLLGNVLIGLDLGGLSDHRELLSCFCFVLLYIYISVIIDGRDIAMRIAGMNQVGQSEDGYANIYSTVK